MIKSRQCLADKTFVIRLSLAAKPLMLQFDQATLDTFEEEFTQIAFDLFGRGRQSTGFTVCDHQMRAWCRCSPRVIAKLWNLLDRTNALQELATKERLLWGSESFERPRE